MKRQTSVMIPRWVKGLNTDKLIPGRVYNIYSCRVCVLDHLADKLRKSRKVCKMKKGVSKSHTQCACSKRGKYLLKIKVCGYCGKITYGAILSKGHCVHCYSYVDYKNLEPYIDDHPIVPIPELKPFYRMNKLVESNEDLEMVERWNCVLRDDCLKCTFKPGMSKAKLGCRKCPNYTKHEFL